MSTSSEDCDAWDSDEDGMDEISPEMWMQLIAKCKQRLGKDCKKTVPSLQDFCLKTIKKKLRYFASLEHPFSSLTSPVLSLVQDAVGDVYDPKYVSLFITAETCRVTLKLFDNDPNDFLYDELCKWTRAHVKNVFQRLSEICKDKLTSLSLVVRMERVGMDVEQPRLSELHKLLKNQSNLTHLDLSDCEIKDNTLAVIGCTCEQLSFLNVDGNRNITDNGIGHLCKSSKVYGRCLKLTSLNVRGTVVTAEAIYLALCNLSELQFIECGHLLSLAVEKYIKKKGTASNLALKGYISHPELDLSRIYTFLPNITHVCLSQTNQDPTTQLLGLQNFFQHFGANLDTLMLSRFSIPIDLSIIGKFCPNIKHLNFNVITCSTNCAYEFTDTFTLLETFCLAHLSNDSIPLPLLIQILSSKHLIKLDLSNYGDTEDSTQELLDLAEGREGMFSNLREFKLPYFRHDSYDLSTLLCLISLAPRLKEVNVDEMVHRLNDIMKLHDFIAEAGAKTDVIRTK